MRMSRLRTLFTALFLALALAAIAPTPGAAAGSRLSDPDLALTHFVPRWIVSLFEKTGWHIDPNGLDGTETTDGGGGGIGMHIDPNG
jgi:hypothetical protein